GHGVAESDGGHGMLLLVGSPRRGRLVGVEPVEFRARPDACRRLGFRNRGSGRASVGMTSGPVSGASGSLGAGRCLRRARSKFILEEPSESGYHNTESAYKRLYSSPRRRAEDPDRSACLFHQHWSGPVALRKHLFEIRHLGQVVDGDVGIARILGLVVMVVVLGRDQARRRLAASDNRPAIYAAGIELRDVGIGNLPLGSRGGEDRRTVLGPDIRTLAFYLDRFGDHREEDLEQRAV